MKTSEGEALGQFFARVFRDEGVRTVTQARARVEAEFRDKYRPHQDLLDYMKEIKGAVTGASKARAR